MAHILFKDTIVSIKKCPPITSDRSKKKKSPSSLRWTAMIDNTSRGKDWPSRSVACSLRKQKEGGEEKKIWLNRKQCLTTLLHIGVRVSSALMGPWWWKILPAVQEGTEIELKEWIRKWRPAGPLHKAALQKLTCAAKSKEKVRKCASYQEKIK